MAPKAASGAAKGVPGGFAFSVATPVIAPRAVEQSPMATINPENSKGN